MLTNLLENNSKNPAVCKKHVFNIFEITYGIKFLFDSQKDQIKEFYIACIKENGKDGDGNMSLRQGAENFMGTCSISLREWNEMEHPVLCEGSFFEMEFLDEAERRKVRHPVLNKPQEIIFFEDPFILCDLQELGLK